MSEKLKIEERPYIVSYDTGKNESDIYLPDFDLHKQGEGCPCKPRIHPPLMDPTGAVMIVHNEYKQLSFGE